MTEPTIKCSRCGEEIKLTESLAAPLIELKRREFEETLVNERAQIVENETRKAKLASASDLDRMTKEVADLHLVLKERDAKLTEAQGAQAELVRKTRVLDDDKREMELTIETRIKEAHDLERQTARRELEAQLKAGVAERDKVLAVMQIQIDGFKKKDADLANREVALAKGMESLDAKLAERLSTERAKIAAEEGRKIKLAVQGDLDVKAKEIADLQEVLMQRDAKLADAQKTQAEFLRKERALDDAKRELELNVEVGIREGLTATRDQAKKEVEEQLGMKMAEKEQTITSMQTQIEALKRRAEQGSQKLQGEVQELALEELLKTNFPRDRIEPVPSGEHGGDIVQSVISPAGQVCGTILWESKRTKNWSDGWLPKLRDDQRAAKAEVAVIFTHVLPKGVETFGLVDGVWVTHPPAAIPVCVALRQMLIEVARVRWSSEGQQTKKEMVYEYLTGPRFRLRVEAIIESFSSMKDDLEREKKAITKQWAKRDEQIGRVMQATVGMYGDFQGIAGKTLLEIEGLEFPALSAPSHEGDGSRTE